MDEPPRDPRVLKKGICGVTRVGGTGIEWICIAEVHDKVYERHRQKFKGPAYSSNPIVDQHYMVPRWPMRKKEEDG